MVLEYLDHVIEPAKDSGRNLSILLMNERGQIIEQSFRIPADYSNGSEIRDICDFVKAESTPCHFKAKNSRKRFEPWEPHTEQSYEEKTAFESMHFQRSRVLNTAKKLARDPQAKKPLEQMLTAYVSAKEIEASIIEENLGLVYAMARRIKGLENLEDESQSAGFQAIVRALKSFDPERGFRFSTYACRAIVKGLFKIRAQRNKNARNAPFDERFCGPYEDRKEEEYVSQITFVREMLERGETDLTGIEIEVLRRRLNFGEHEHAGSTLENIGKATGLSKERIRQIQNKALRKLREAMERDHFENPAYQD